MPWIALKSMKVKRGGNYVDVSFGEEVPEAEDWPNRSSYVRTRYIKWVDPIVVETSEEQKPKKRKTKKKPKSVEMKSEEPAKTVTTRPMVFRRRFFQLETESGDDDTSGD